VAHFRQLYLALPLLGPAAGFLRQAVVAVRTADALLIEWRCHILGRHGMTTGMALIEGARCQVMAHGDPVIEDEAFTLPFALLGRHVLEIFQDTALEVVDLFEAL